MANNDSRKFSGTPPAANDMGKDIPTANEPAADPSLAGGSLSFDPRESFYPQVLLKAHDLKDSPLAAKPPAPRPFRPIVKVFVALLLAMAAGLAYFFFLSGPTPPPGAKNVPNAPFKDPKAAASATGAITAPSATATPSATSAPPAATATPRTAPPEPAPAKPAPPVAAARVPASPVAAAPARPAASSSLPTYTYRPPATGQSTITHTKAAADAAQSGVPIAPAPAPAAAAVAPAAPPPSNARTGPCSEALAALGLCAPAAKPEEKK